MMKSNKLLSVIVPSYNMEAYLAKNISSMMVQDEALRQLVEVIVVNDGSKDRTSEIAHEFAEKYPGCVTVIDKANGHYGSCINAALPVAKGKYIRVVDADDWVDTDNFSEYINYLLHETTKGEECADLIVNDFEFVDKDATIVKSYSWIKDSTIVADFDYRDGRDPWMHALAYKTDKIRALGYKQLTGITHTDIQWLHLPMTTVNKIAYFPKIVYKYLYLREGNTSNPDEFYRTYWVQEKILKHLIDEYNTLNCEVKDVHQAYLKGHILYRVYRAYHVHLMERSPLLDDRWLVDLDSYVKENARWAYDAMNDVPFSSKIGWRYIFAWRKRQKYTIWQIGMRCLFEVALSVWGKLRSMR